MKRDEKIRLAFELAGDTRRLVWAMALNDVPVRRAFLSHVADMEEKIVVRLLARLSNAELLAPTDGMFFALGDRGLAAAIRELIPEGELTALCIRSIDGLENSGEDASRRLLAEHSTCLARWDDAAAHIQAAVAEDFPEDRGRNTETLRQMLEGIWMDNRADRALRETVGLTLLAAGRETLKPMETRLLIDRLADQDLSTAGRERLETLAAEIESARKATRAAKKVASADGNNEPASATDVPEEPPVEVEPSTNGAS